VSDAEAGPFDGVSRVIKGATSVVPLVPGIAMLTKAVPMPPDLQTVMTSLSLAVGVLIVISALLLKAKTRTLSVRLSVIIAACLFLLGAISAVQYLHFAAAYVCQFEYDGKSELIVRPLDPPPELSKILDDFNGDCALAVTSPAIGLRVRALFNENNGVSQGLLLFYLLTAQAMVMASVVGAAWKGADLLSRR
jgi:hypothetical protein